MASKLSDLLEQLEPLPSNYHVNALKAIDSYPLRYNPTGTIEEFNDFFARFHCHIRCHIMGIHLSADDHYDLHKDWALELLSEIFGGMNGWLSAKRSMEDGDYSINDVMEKFAIHMATKALKKRIDVLVYSFWNSLSSNEWEDVRKEYMDRYSDMVPPSYSNYLVTPIKMVNILRNHPFILQQRSRR